MSGERESRPNEGDQQQQQFHQQQLQHRGQEAPELHEQQTESSGESTIPVLRLNGIPSCRQQLGHDFTQAAFGFVLEEDLHSVLEPTNPERKKLLLRFFRMVNTLLNQGGGLVFIHTSPDLLGFWDEQVDDQLMALVPDDTLFDENFERYVIKDHVIVRVKPLRIPLLSTLHFQSRISLNKGLQDPTHGQMRRLLTRPAPDPPQPPQESLDPNTWALVDGQKILFNESCSMQAKVLLALEKSASASIVCKDYASKIMDFWWRSLKLHHYIAAFTKQQNGGSIFLGINEEKGESKTNRKLVSSDSKKKKSSHLAQEKDVPKSEHKRARYFTCKGISLTSEDKETLQTLLKKKVQDLLLLHPRDSTQMQNQPVELHFYPVKKSEGDGNITEATGGEPGVLGRDHKVDDSQVPNLYVVEARVSYFHGVCFQNEHGPEAYKFNYNDCPSRAERVPIKTWIEGQALRETMRY